VRRLTFSFFLFFSRSPCSPLFPFSFGLSHLFFCPLFLPPFLPPHHSSNETAPPSPSLPTPPPQKGPCSPTTNPLGSPELLALLATRSTEPQEQSPPPPNHPVQKHLEIRSLVERFLSAAVTTIGFSVTTFSSGRVHSSFRSFGFPSAVVGLGSRSDSDLRLPPSSLLASSRCVISPHHRRNP